VGVIGPSGELVALAGEVPLRGLPGGRPFGLDSATHTHTQTHEK